METTTFAELNILGLDIEKPYINSFLASSDICRLLISFANCLDPDQESDQQNVGPDLNPCYV